jgi:ketosteroid isomerase-like protein
VAEVVSLTDRLRSCFERQDFAGLDELYAEDAVLELHVGAAHDLYRGRRAVAARYSDDFRSATTFLRWEVREAPWGAVVEAAAVQGGGPDELLFRWVHLLVVERGWISSDAVYCTGGAAAGS